MNRILTAKIAALAVCSLLIWGSLVSAAGIATITKEELKARQEDQDLIVLDVRAKMNWLFSASKIKGAVREDPTSVQAWRDKYPKDKTIVLYCHTDYTSSGVARELASAGFQKVEVLQGGWSAWSAAGYPTEKK